MPITLGSNIASLKAQRRFGENIDALARVYERLASGQRINRASDDAAGLSVATSLSTDSRVFSQALRNVNDGISLLNIADGALSTLSSITIRQKELAEQAANGSYSLAQRKAIDAEANALVDEFNRVVQSSTFNGRQLFDTNQGVVTLQVGRSSDRADSISIAIGTMLTRTVGTGTFGAQTTFATGTSPYAVSSGDFNGDGAQDVITSDYGSNAISVLLGNGNGSFKSRVTYTTGTKPLSLVSGDLNGDGVRDVVVGDYGDTTISVLIGNGDGSFRARTTLTTGANPEGLVLGDLNGDGKLDLATSSFTTAATTVYFGNGDGTFSGATTLTPSSATQTMYGADFNGDGSIDLVTIDRFGSGQTLSVFINNGDGAFQSRATYLAGASSPTAIASADFNHDGYNDLALASVGTPAVSVLISNGNGSFKAAITMSAGAAPRGIDTADLNGDGYFDIISDDRTDNAVHVLLGNGNGSFRASVSYATGLAPTDVDAIDFNGDRVPDLVTDDRSSNYISVRLADTTQSATIAHVSLLDAVSARTAIGTFDNALSRITLERAAIGSAQSRLDSAARSVSTTVENFRAAVGRIRDADVASDAAELVRRQILQSATAAVLAQANQQPAIALSLLGT